MAASDSAVTIDLTIQRFLSEPCNMLIDGKWVEAASGQTFPVYNPATDEVREDDYNALVILCVMLRNCF